MRAAWNNPTVRWTCYLVYGSVLLGLLIPTGQAMELRSGNEVVIAADETIEDDLYVAAAHVVIDGTVQGDVIAAAQTVTVTGMIEGDLMAAAQSITVRGHVQDTARLAAAVITVTDSGQVGGDVVAAGYSLETQAGSQLGGDLLFAGRQALLAGDLTGSARMAGYGLLLRGRLGGNLQAELAAPGQRDGLDPSRFMPGLPPTPAVAAGLTLAEGATIAGNLELTTPRDVQLPAGVVQGEVRTEIVNDRATGWRAFVFGSLSRYVTLVMIGLLLLWLAPALLTRASASLGNRPGSSLGWGALLLIGVPIILLIALALVFLLAVLLGWLTLGGLAGAVGVLGAVLAVLLGVLFVLALVYLPAVVVGYWGGRWLLERWRPGLAANAWLALLVGLLLVVILTALPFIGWWVSLAFVLLGLGALWLGRRSRDRQQVRVSVPPA